MTSVGESLEERHTMYLALHTAVTAGPMTQDWNVGQSLYGTELLEMPLQHLVVSAALSILGALQGTDKLTAQQQGLLIAWPYTHIVRTFHLNACGCYQVTIVQSVDPFSAALSIRV
jgi:hypothetical protein